VPAHDEGGFGVAVFLEKVTQKAVKFL